MNTGVLKDGVLVFAHYKCACTACDAQGALKLEHGERGPFGCPAGCGATYIAWHHPQDKPHKFRLQCVVLPHYGPDKHRGMTR